MRDAVIVSTARTGLAKSFRGALNNTHGATMGGHVVSHAMSRAKIDCSTIFACQSGDSRNRSRTLSPGFAKSFVTRPT